MNEIGAMDTKIFAQEPLSNRFLQKQLGCGAEHNYGSRTES